MRSFCSSTCSRAVSEFALAASVAAQLFPKSQRSWEAENRPAAGVEISVFRLVEEPVEEKTRW